MKSINLFMFFVIWMFAACSSTSDTVKPDTSEPEKFSSSKGNKEIFHDKASGISITIPEGWKKVTPEMLIEARQSLKLSDKDLEKMVKKNPDLPLLVIIKYPEPYPTLNPKVTVSKIYIPVEGIPPKDFLRINTQLIKRGFPDITYVDEIQDTDVGGINSAYTKVNFTMTDGDRKFPTTTRLWLVPRGLFMIIIGMSGPQEGPDASEDVFKEIFKSIKLEKLSM